MSSIFLWNFIPYDVLSVSWTLFKYKLVLIVIVIVVVNLIVCLVMYEGVPSKALPSVQPLALHAEIDNN